MHFIRTQSWRSLLASGFSLVLLSGCGSSAGAGSTNSNGSSTAFDGDLSDADRIAKDAESNAKAEFSKNDGRSLVSHAETAMKILEPVIKRPDLLHVKLVNDISFDGTAARLVTVSPYDISDTLRRIAEEYEHAGMWARAAEVRRKAFEFEAQWEKSHPASPFRGKLLPNCSLALSKTVDYVRSLQRAGMIVAAKIKSDQAIATLKKLERQAGADQDKGGIGKDYDELGVLALERGESVRDVQPLFDRAVALTEGSIATAIRSQALVHRGDMFLLQKQYDKAAADYRSAYAVEEKTYNDESKLNEPGSFAKLYSMQGNNSKAIQTLQPAIDQIKRPGISRDVAKHLVELAYYYEHDGKPQQAQKVLARVTERIAYLAAFTGAGCGYPGKKEADALRSDVETISKNKNVLVDELRTCSPAFEYYRI